MNCRTGTVYLFNLIKVITKLTLYILIGFFLIFSYYVLAYLYFKLHNKSFKLVLSCIIKYCLY